MNSLRLIPARSWFLVLSSALLQTYIFPIAGPVSPPRAAIGWFALVPFLAALLQPDRAGRPLRTLHDAVLGYLCGILWYLGNCYWIYQTMYLYGALPKPVAFAILILFALYLGLYHAGFAILLAVIRKSRFGIPGALFLAPFFWVAIELARTRITGFPWDLLGYSQIDNLLLTRVAPIAGVMAISFVLAAANAALAGYLLLKGAQRLWIPASAAILAIFLQAGSLLIQDHSLADAGQQAVMMQENLEVGAVGRNQRPLSTAEELSVFSRMTLNPGYSLTAPSTPGATLSLLPGMHPTILIWPEAPSQFESSDPSFRTAIANLVRTAQAPAIIGSLGVDLTSLSSRGYFLYDSASLFNSAGTYQGRYDKIHLVPWGEYVPFKQVFAFAQKLTAGVGDMDRGVQRSVFTADGHRYGIFVCYESIFGDEVRHFALNGAQVLVNISDDGWYGDTGAPWQHLNMTRMRAIENRRWLLLDTNTGITTSIDPNGRPSVEAPRHIRAAFAFPFAFTQGVTFYTRHGDWFAWFCCLFAFCTTVIAAADTWASVPGAARPTPPRRPRSAASRKGPFRV